MLENPNPSLRDLPTSDAFHKVLRKAIEHELEKVIEEEAVKAAEAAGKRARALAPQIAVALMRSFRIETLPNQYQINIYFDVREQAVPLLPKSILI